MRLQNILAQAGIASRRKSAEIIQAGRVQVNGKVETVPGAPVDPASDAVLVDGKPVKAEKKRYFIFHKPLNVITTMKDESGRKSVVEYFKSIEERVFPVGRLDRNTTGLLIVTNDGEFANQLMHPRNEIEKYYVTIVDQRLNPSQMKRFEMGIALDKRKTAPCRVI
ncbi:MAG: rRNA pseudouridine synthase, partial [Candidatus Omnitrophica bacterium]|nr:rRNA pseudouridine synthase [Candidatus Omnitrophota bacterium]